MPRQHQSCTHILARLSTPKVQVCSTLGRYIKNILKWVEEMQWLLVTQCKLKDADGFSFGLVPKGGRHIYIYFVSG